MPDPSTPWHPEVLPAEWSRASGALASRSALDGFYLAGGTGLALQFGHRRSADLDLFRETDFDAAAVRDRLRNLEELGALETAPGTLHLRLHDVKVSVLHYPYPRLYPLQTFGRLPVADPRDIACMKIEAIASRGSRRDFVDLYVAATAYGLDQILEWFGRKYASVSYSRTHLFKALTYFLDAEQEPMPDMLAPLDWSVVREYFVRTVPRLPRLV